MRLQSKFISGSMLKVIAMATMLLDHIAAHIFFEIPFFTKALFTAFSRKISIYFICRMIGRLAFPIYCFLLVEGFIHTRDRRRYGMRLLIFALIPELPWNFVHTGRVLCDSQNVMFTLLFGYTALCVAEQLENDKPKQLFALISLFAVCMLGGADYGVSGLGLILIMYYLRQRRALQAICTGCMLSYGYAAALAFVPISLYNGERGFMRGGVSKYAAYLFYPVHLLLIGIVKYYLM